MTQQQIVIRKLLINYYEKIGTAGAPILVFLHGWRADGKIWMPIADRLGDGTVYCLDLPGFGKSQTPKTAYSVGDYANIVREFVLKLGAKQIILIGHSFGGRIAIKLASERPQWLARLVLVNSAGIRRETVANKLINVASKVLRPLTPQPVKERLYQLIGAEDYLTAGDLKATFVKVINEDLRPDLEKIQVPSLLIWGKEDTDTPVAYGEIMHSLIPNSRLLILSNAGHYSFIDKPQEFVEELKSFILS